MVQLEHLPENVEDIVVFFKIISLHVPVVYKVIFIDITSFLKLQSF